MKFLAISGSLRASSTNSTLLRALPLIAPEVSFTSASPLDALPYFNPDVEAAGPPDVVMRWRDEIRTHDALVICSPEYAHGVPGVLKNAIDWLVGGVEIHGKPIAVINTSLPSTIAHASLVDILSVIGGRVIPAASIGITLRSKRMDERGMAADPELAAELRSCILALEMAVDRI